MAYQIASDPVPEGADMSDAPMEAASPDAAKADAAVGSLGLRSTSPGAPEPAAAPAKAADGKVTLATEPPLGSLTLSPLGDEEGVIITEAGTEVDAETAERAHAEAMLAGFRLREV
jgi:hypothetical protein